MLLSLATNHGTTDSMVNDKLGQIVNKIPTALFKAYSCVWAFFIDLTMTVPGSRVLFLDLTSDESIGRSRNWSCPMDTVLVSMYYIQTGCVWNYVFVWICVPVFVCVLACL